MFSDWGPYTLQTLNPKPKQVCFGAFCLWHPPLVSARHRKSKALKSLKGPAAPKPTIEDRNPALPYKDHKLWE